MRMCNQSRFAPQASLASHTPIIEGVWLARGYVCFVIMYSLAVLLVCFSLVQCCVAVQDFPGPSASSENRSRIWGVLVAGSNGWDNYCDQVGALSLKNRFQRSDSLSGSTSLVHIYGGPGCMDAHA